ncbi:MAG: hypothetical protein KGQ52_09060 [Alphaproteobacteria bacterium]|nr:hypothetical protein [Alphaproteobacteria bacterium]
MIPARTTLLLAAALLALPAAAAPRQAASAPTPEETAAFLATRPDGLKPYWANLWAGGERNAVLNFQRLGLAAMQLGDFATAEKAFDAALLRIEGVYGNNRLAARARSTFAREANKDFKGEPYERAMAYYYRGLLYLRAGDYGNARASFKNAEFQDSVSESEEFQADFAAMNYLIGWSTRCMGGSDGAADFAAAARAQPGITMPPRDHNLLLVAETGAGPIKLQDGALREKLVFRRREANPPEQQALFQFAASGGPAVVAAQPVSSLAFQATTRGGRAIDGILKGKASFKATTGGIANAAFNAGFALMGNGRDNSNAGAVLAGVGALFALFSSAARAEADVRYWDQLPETLGLATTVAAAADPVDVRFINGDGRPPSPPAALMQGGDASCRIVWARSRTALVPGDVRGDDDRVRASVARRRDTAARNRQLREALMQM